jgi:sulfofructose kinase
VLPSDLVRIPISLPAPGTRPFDVVGLGLNSVDLLVAVERHPQPNSKQPAERLSRQPGGQAATAMATCARLGWKSRYIGRFGGDENGLLGRQSLVDEGVDVSASQTIEGATNQFAVVIVDSGTGDRTVIWSRHPGLTMKGADVPRDAVISGRMLLVDCHDTEAAVEAARYARAAGMPTVVDVEKVRPRIHELLREIDCIIAAEAFPGALTGRADLGEALAAIDREFRPQVVCVTLGREGSLARCGGREIRTPGFTGVRCVDSTGAGDVFRGGFIAGCLAGGGDAQIEDVLRYANAAAALKCRSLGARRAIPRPHEVAELLSRTPAF